MVYYCEIEKENGLFISRFPDMSNVKTCGDTQEEALCMAADALNAVLESEIAHGFPVRPPAYTKGYPIAVANHIVVSIRLRELRGNESQASIAKKLGLTYQSYQRLENPQKSNPTVKTLEKIAHVFGKNLQVQIV
jgi:antitoxin HicB